MRKTAGGYPIGSLHFDRNADTDETHEFTGEQLMTKGLNVYFPRLQVSHMIYFDKK